MQLKRRVREVSALVRSSALISSTLDLDNVLTLILEQLAEVLQYDRALDHAALREPPDGSSRPRVSRQEQRDRPELRPRQNELTRRLLAGDAPIVLQDVTVEPNYMQGRERADARLDRGAAPLPRRSYRRACT